MRSVITTNNPVKYNVRLLTSYVPGYCYRDIENRQMSHVTALCIFPFLLFCILKHTECIISPLDLRITHYWVTVCQYSCRLGKMTLSFFSLYFPFQRRSLECYSLQTFFWLLNFTRTTTIGMMITKTMISFENTLL